MLTVTAQQSRFHNEAIEGSALKEARLPTMFSKCSADNVQIVVKDLSISIGQREILSHAQFQFQVGKHYVLVGRNGVGKSS
jgi:ABC-type molybdenum transport system ATPase subunit/photorepair protein PhrA